MYFLQRLREPSTWAGLAALAAMFGVPTGTAQAVAQAGVALAGAAAVLLPEQKPGQ
ncbi:hypothetical protein OYT13_11400 [Pandoraea sp. XJJ-1]|uniref:hypothetical protein n=1 Tax=Pandoraea sp. XJJ-1 TaxID=3002643 RepID=UPI002281D073|nr:hypothetical protein [Pandoraea sp. XJJ-1]WAL84953.1 hypothetical protein OYT13_11400 [Pandoraea sp. XJJ-1]